MNEIGPFDRILFYDLASVQCHPIKILGNNLKWMNLALKLSRLCEPIQQSLAHVWLIVKASCKTPVQDAWSGGQPLVGWFSLW
jgi:hypothetical protein